MKKLLAIVISMAMIVAMMPMGVFADGEVIKIASAADLAKIGVDKSYPLNGNYELTGDITLSENWTPIGTGSRSESTYIGNAFTGTFDGKNHTISKLTLTSLPSEATKDYAIGLFGVVDGGTVKNLKLENVNINVSESELAGGAVGLLVNSGIVDNITVSGTVSAKRGNGGIVGRVLKSGTISNCINNAIINGTGANVGGIVGAAYYTENDKEMAISNCTNNGAIIGNASGVGGIAGLSAAAISACKNSGNITGGTYSVGGIAGEYQSYGSVTDCSNTANVTTTVTLGTGNFGTGGIVGWIRYNENPKNYPLTKPIEIKNNANTGNVSSTGDSAGGIVGHVHCKAVITGNINTAERISSGIFAAGIVGSIQEYPADKCSWAQGLNVNISNNTTTTDVNSITGQCKDLVAYNNITSPAEGEIYICENNITGIAKVNNTGYTTLQAAFDAASDSDATIKLIKDVTLNATLNINSGRIILDLDGNTINVTKSDRPIRTGATKYHSNGIHITGNSDLTIIGNGTIKAPDGGSICASMDSSSLMQVEGENAKLTILNGNLSAGGEGSNGMYGIYICNGGNVVLGNAEAGPTIKTFCAAVGENNTTSPANITINNGVYTETLTPADSDWWAYFCAPIYAASSGDITINGGTFNGYYGISTRYKNVKQNITISGGTFNGSKSAIFVDNEDGSGTTEAREIVVKGGTFSTSPEDYVATGYKVNQISENSYEVVKEYTGGGAVVPPATDNVTNNPADKNTTADLAPAVKDNKAETTVDAKTADKIVDKAIENKSTEVIVDATGNNTVASSEVAIPEKTVKELAEKTDANLVIKTDNGKVDLDRTALAAVAEQAGTTGTVRLVVETVKTDENICHVDLKLITSNGAVKDFKGGNVKVTINLTKELAAKELVCVYIDDNGIYTLVEGVLNADGTYTFTTGHFSEYAVMAKAEADKKIAEQLNTMIKDVNLKVRTSKTAKKNIKAVVSGDVKALTDAGYTVKYKFYRSEKKASKYVSKGEKTADTYINTAGKKGTKYYYKAKAMVYSGDTLVGQTVLTQCKYGARTWSK